MNKYGHFALVILLAFTIEAFASTVKFLCRENEYRMVVKDRAMEGRKILSQSEISLIRCAVLCLRHARCLSFNHKNTGGICQLNRATMEEFPAGLQHAAGFSFFEIRSGAAQKVGALFTLYLITMTLV